MFQTNTRTSVEVKDTINSDFNNKFSVFKIKYSDLKQCFN